MGAKVLVTSRSFVQVPEALELLHKAGLETRIRTADVPWQENDLLRWIADFDGVVAGLDAFTELVIEAGSRLKVIARVGVGYDNVDVDTASRCAIHVTNAGSAMAASVADLVMAMILNLARHIPSALAAVRRGQWQRQLGWELAAKTLGLLGTGSIGREVAKRALAFGMSVLCHDIRRDVAWAEQCGARYVRLEKLLADSDYVSLHVPLTGQTHGLIGDAELRRMKPTAYLVNTSRGGVVDEAALLRALQEKRLAGAALDVLEREPPEENSLVCMPNVLVTPHIGSATREAVKSASMLAAENVVAVLGGHAPISAVNRF